MKKILSVFLAALLVFGSVALAASASEDSVSVSMVNFNVAGLPSFGGLFGTSDADVAANQKVAADYFNNGGFDIVAVQEDFGYHGDLTAALSGYNYQTNHSGTFIGGDGMNIFTRNMPVYNETRIPWELRAGIFDGGADELSNKGFMYAVIDVGNGILVDFYNIHADAFGGAADREARESNYKQISDYINANYEKNNRPVVLTGDFNHYFHVSDTSNSNMRKHFMENCGLKEAWVELNNNGDYVNFDTFFENYGGSYSQCWGVWDSVEKFMYKNGGGVEIKPESFTYTWIEDANGVRISDHAAAECVLTFTKTADFVENTQELTVVPAKNYFLNTLVWFIKDLVLVLQHWDELMAFING